MSIKKKIQNFIARLFGIKNEYIINFPSNNNHVYIDWGYKEPTKINIISQISEVMGIEDLCERTLNAVINYKVKHVIVDTTGAGREIFRYLLTVLPKDVEINSVKGLKHMDAWSVKNVYKYL
jgi:hypothetical protein